MATRRFNRSSNRLVPKTVPQILGSAPGNIEQMIQKYNPYNYRMAQV